MADIVIPKHIGFIVDGNRRWAKQHGLHSFEGHLAGYNTLKDIMLTAFENGVDYVSAYAFSTENWKRSQDEVSKLMQLALRLLISDLNIFEENNIRLRILCSRDKLSGDILKAIDNAEAKTINNTAGTFALCFNYGGQHEIVDAVKKIVSSGLSVDNITTDLIGRNLYAPDIPSVDIVVRTSGEKRLSNFMLWRTAYSEIMFIDKMWPDMTKDDVTNIIKEYNNYQGDTHECNQVYLGMCLDEENKFYGCNLIDEECNVEDLMLVKRIKYLEDNNIQIYGSSQCPYCNKEYEEFGKYGLSVKERGLFFFCDLTPVDGCKDVESVPAWKQNGTIIHVGYQPLSIFDSYIK